MSGRSVYLIGGGAGTGKTTLAQALARQLGAGWLQLDTIWLALTDAPGVAAQVRETLDLDARLRRGTEPDDVLLTAHISASEVVCRALPRAMRFEQQAHERLIIEGAWLTPSFAAGLELSDTTVRSVFLHEPDPDRLRASMDARRSSSAAAVWHARSARLAWAYGSWVAEEARRLGLHVVPSQPWETLGARAALAPEVHEPTEFT